MIGRHELDRLVVVHGDEDELLAVTLSLAGLEAVYLTPDLTVWAPTRWGLETHPYPSGTRPHGDVTETADLFIAYLNQGDPS